MSLSFIIPALNEEKHIGKCVAAIAPQLEDDDEIIVVDNGSTDQTVAIARQHGARVVTETKKGISNARNAGVLHSKGNIVCFIDADGILSPNWAKMTRAHLNQRDINAVVGLNVFAHRQAHKFLIYNGYTILAYSGVVLLKLLKGNMYLAGNNLAIRKKIFTNLGGFEPVVGEDYWFSKKFWQQKNKKAVFDPRLIVKYSSRGFDTAGYFKTLQLWLKSSVTKIPQDTYRFDNKSL